MRSFACALVCNLVLGLLPARVHADALDEAKRIAKQAATQYQLGHFQEASESYSKSYEAVPTPGLLFNIGQCQMMLKNYERAVFLFEGYLQNKPDAPNLVLVRDLIAEARRELAAQAAKVQADDAERRAAAARLQPPPPPPPAAAMPTDKKRIAAVALGAASIALVGSSVYLGQRADLADTFASASGFQTTVEALDDQHRRYMIAAATVGAVGAAAAVASGVLGYYGWRRAKAVVVAAPVAGGAAAVVLGRF